MTTSSLPSSQHSPSSSSISRSPASPVFPLSPAFREGSLPTTTTSTSNSRSLPLPAPLLSPIAISPLASPREGVFGGLAGTSRPTSSARASPVVNLASSIRSRVEAQRLGKAAAVAGGSGQVRLVVNPSSPPMEPWREVTPSEEDQVLTPSVFARSLSKSPAPSSAPSTPATAMPLPITPTRTALTPPPPPALSAPTTPLAPPSAPLLSPNLPARSSAPTTPTMPLLTPQPSTPSGPSTAPPSPSPLHSLHSTLALAQQQQRSSPHATPTLRGHMAKDLLSAAGPVPIAFELSATGALVPVQQQQQQQHPTSQVLPLPTPQRRAVTQPYPSPTAAAPTTPNSPTPTANFFPKPRPRSRSFSNYTTNFTEVPMPLASPPSPPEENAGGSEEGGGDNGGKENVPEKEKVYRLPSVRATAAALKIRAPPASAVVQGLRSPLPSSPLARSVTPARNEDGEGQEIEMPRPVVGLGLSVRGEASSAPSTPLREVTEDDAGRSRPSLTLNTDSGPSSVVQTPSPPIQITRSSSLRSKLSMPALKRNATRTESPVSDHIFQVQDAEFELVRPTMPVSGDEGSFNGSLDSPGLSPGTGLNGSPVTSPSTAAPKTTSFIASSASVEAHRALELRWISTMSTIKSAGARKQKKVKRLVWDGVPSSVRGLVWAYLTDAKARRLPGVYDKLVARGAGDKWTVTIAKDLDRLFPDHPHLRDPNGSLVKLLQAYLCMVPDVQYDRELAMVAGNILSLSPEEDAFWTFVAVMDNQIRLYFTVNPIQLDVDGQLFVKATEALDPQLAKLIFDQCGVPATLLCKAWFAALFCTVLPPAHLQRVWDVYLLEGQSFLFRTGLVILLAARKHLQAPSAFPPSALTLLTRPPASIFDPDPEAFISKVASTKLRDEDLKRLRPKVEAQVKLTQAPQRHHIVNRDIIKSPTIIPFHAKALASSASLASAS